MLSLKHPYISVAYKSGPSFGGSQNLSNNRTLASCGCGVIAAADLLLYISAWHKGLPILEQNPENNYSIEETAYQNWITQLNKRYFPLIPHFGMNGLGLMFGMEAYFKRHGLPYSCHWCVSDKGIWNKVQKMLEDDIPVIMSVGPNFPFIWKKGKAVLYYKNDSGEYVPASSVKAHFISITGMDEQWLEISSWGKRLYLNRRMYEEYVSKYSAALVSNILYIRKKGHTDD